MSTEADTETETEAFAGYANGESAVQAQEELQAERAASVISAHEGEQTREHVQSAEDPETVTIAVRDDEIPCEPIGALKRTRLFRDAIRAEEQGTDLEEMEAILAMGQALVDHSAEEFGQDYWDKLSQHELRGAFIDLATQSAGGERAPG